VDLVSRSSSVRKALKTASERRLRSSRMASVRPLPAAVSLSRYARPGRYPRDYDARTEVALHRHRSPPAGEGPDRSGPRGGPEAIPDRRLF